MAKEPECIARLVRIGISYDDAHALRRIAMTLHRWHELECGIDGGGVERDETTGKVYWYNAMTGRRSPFPDRETPALRRLVRLMAKYPLYGHYVQGDPRGASLYIFAPGAIKDGEEVNAYYSSRGVAVYK